MLDTNYTYRATTNKVIDGDTVDLDIDVGFHMTSRQRVRVARIDTPEINDKDELVRASAAAARTRVINLIIGKPLVVMTKKADLYGRYLAEIYVDLNGQQVNVSDVLLAEGLAIIYGSK